MKTILKIEDLKEVYKIKKFLNKKEIVVNSIAISADFLKIDYDICLNVTVKYFFNLNNGKSNDYDINSLEYKVYEDINKIYKEQSLKNFLIDYFDEEIFYYINLIQDDDYHKLRKNYKN